MPAWLKSKHVRCKTMSQKRTSYSSESASLTSAVKGSSISPLHAAPNPHAIYDDIAASSGCGTHDRRAPWRYATGSIDAFGTALASVVLKVIVVLNVATAIVASKIARIVGSRANFI
jgi:hypothetical protein